MEVEEEVVVEAEVEMHVQLIQIIELLQNHIILMHLNINQPILKMLVLQRDIKVNVIKAYIKMAVPTLL